MRGRLLPAAPNAAHRQLEKPPKLCWAAPPGGWCPALAPPRTSARQPPWAGQWDGGLGPRTAPGIAPGLSVPCSSRARAREGAGEFLQHHRGAPQTPGACSAPRWSLGRWPGAGRGGAAQLPEANRGEHRLGDSSCPYPAPSHSQHEKGEEKSLPQHRQRRALEATSTLQDGHTALEARDGGSSARLGGTELLGRCGGNPGTAAPRLPGGTRCCGVRLLAGRWWLQSECLSWGRWVCVGRTAGSEGTAAPQPPATHSLLPPPAPRSPPLQKQPPAQELGGTQTAGSWGRQEAKCPRGAAPSNL